MRKSSSTLLALALIAGACSSGGSTDPVASPTERSTDPNVELDSGDIRLLSALVPFADCSELLGHLQTEARERVGPYGLDTGGWGFWEEEFFFGGDDAVEEEAMEASVDFDAGGDDGGASFDTATSEAAPQGNFERVSGDLDDSGGEGGGVDFTGTNVQELGVDEPDIVKTDGTRILVVQEQQLTYVDVSSGDPIKTDSIRIDEGWGHELFFQGDRALLFTNGGNWGGPIPVEPRPLSSTVTDAEAEFAETSPIVEDRWWGPAASIIEIDMSDPEDLEITGTMRIEGSYLSARRVGNTVRMALTSPPTQLEWVYPSSPAGEDRAERFNRELIDETVIEDWIPEYSLSVDGETTGGPLLACDRLHRPAEFSGFDVVSVLSFDLTNGLNNGDGAGVLASGQTVYSSTDRFYIATTQWAGEEVIADGDIVSWSENYTTDIHAFSISPEEPATYVASGMVDGSLLNQFSMDEHDGYLRIITTEGSPWNDRDLSQTGLTVLDEDGDVLVPVGRVTGLGEGETLYSARLLDDVGFAVTFRQIDPFYVLDLSDPTNPTVSGELKIPGFSTYLHPISPDYVLGIGQDATEEGRTIGLKVSLFKVADPSNPTEVATWTLANANSPAEWDHRAFQWLADRNLAIVPTQNWSGESGAVLLRVDDETITEVGTITHEEAKSDPSSDCDVVDTSGLGEDNELFWIGQEEGARIQYCGADQQGGYGSWYCEPIPLEELRFWGAEDTMSAFVEGLAGGEPDPEDRIELCWPNGGDWRRQIQRSLVIEDTLWTVSIAQLQANDLDDLTTTATVAF